MTTMMMQIPDDREDDFVNGRDGGIYYNDGKNC